MSKHFEDKKRILREKAKKKISKTDLNIDDLSQDQLKALIEDYQLYQIELEIQNEELRDAQSKLQQSRDRFAKLYNEAPVGYLTVDPNGIIILTNQTFADMAGKNPDQISGKALAELILPEDRSSFHGRFRAFFKNPYHKQMDFRLSRKQGSLWVRCTGRIEDDVQHCSYEGQKCLLMAVSDVSKQILAEKNLQESEERFRLLSDLTMEGIVIHKSGVVRDLNQALPRIFGYESDELMGQNILELTIHDEDKDIVKSNIVKEYAQPYVIRAVRKNGEIFYAELEARNFPIGSEMLRVAAVRDITKRKEAEDKIKLINQQLEEANEQKEKLLSIIAHDLKSPMAGVFSISQFLASDIQSLSQKEVIFISDEIHKSMENSMILLDDLMQWAQMSSGGTEFFPEKCDIHKLIIPTLDTARGMAKRKNIKIRSEIPEGLNIVADQSMINTVIRNLIFNAIKFTDKDGNVFIKAKKTEAYVEVCIQDDGIGMNDKVLSTIFMVDKNKRQLGTEGEKGTGLGLILCKEFVEKHGGQIWLESKPERGTKVFFTLPVESNY